MVGFFKDLDQINPTKGQCDVKGIKISYIKNVFVIKILSLLII